MPHALQLFGSVCKLLHELLQLVSPAPQVVWQVLVEQTCPLEHWFPQDPQLFTSELVLTQAPLQLTPVAHPPSGNMPASFGRTVVPPSAIVVITPLLLPLPPLPPPLLPPLPPLLLLLDPRLSGGPSYIAPS
jgi:hypothetical protein